MFGLCLKKMSHRYWQVKVKSIEALNQKYKTLKKIKHYQLIHCANQNFINAYTNFVYRRKGNKMCTCICKSKGNLKNIGKRRYIETFFLAAVTRLICISDESSYFETVYMYGCYISNVYIASFIKQIKSKFSCVTEWTMHAYTCIDIWSDNLKKNASKEKFLSNV